jgi:hypothetical protein
MPAEVLTERLMLAIYAYGTNTGIRTIAGNAQHGHGEDDIRYVRRRYLTAEVASTIAVEIANATFAARAQRICGAGSTAVASDSTHFGAFDQNLFTEWHSRYGGRGVLIYWHVERKSLAIHSQLISCSASEVAAMIEGPIRHGTAMEVEGNYTDSHGLVVTWTPCPSLRVRRGRPGRRVRRFWGCLCGYGSGAARMAASGSTCWMRVVSRSGSCRGSCGFWWLGTARPTRSSLMPTIFAICGGSSSGMV